MRYGMAIDTRACSGCSACALACKVSKNLPNKVWYNDILTKGGATRDTAAGTYPNLSMRFYPKACQHCANPVCEATCPTGATYKRDDGIVAVDPDLCIGCRSCMMSCPYEVRTFVGSEIDYCVDHALGDWDAPKHVSGVVEKCTMCANRVDRGEEPACVRACVNKARVWGDLDDPSSEVSKLIASRNHERLLEDMGTEPGVYYLV